MFSTRTLVACFGALFFGSPAPLLAQEPVELVALRWEGYGESEGCLGVPSLIARVEDYLGRRAFDPSSAQVLSVTVDTPGGDRFRAVVRVLDATGKVLGERELVASEPSCSALDDPLVLAVALLVDAALGAEPEPEPLPAPLPPEPPEPEPPSLAPEKAPEPEMAPRPPDPWRIDADLSLLGADGVLPELALGSELGLQVDAPWLFPLRVRVAGFLPQRAELAPEGSIDVTLGLAGLGACPLSLRPRGFGVDACAGVDLLAQRAVSEGLTASRTHTELFFQGSVALRIQADLYGPWYGVLGTNLGLPISAPRFVYRRSGGTVPVFQMADATLVAGLGVGVRLSR